MNHHDTTARASEAKTTTYPPQPLIHGHDAYERGIPDDALLRLARAAWQYAEGDEDRYQEDMRDLVDTYHRTRNVDR